MRQTRGYPLHVGLLKGKLDRDINQETIGILYKEELVNSKTMMNYIDEKVKLSIENPLKQQQQNLNVAHRIQMVVTTTGSSISSLTTKRKPPKHRNPPISTLNTPQTQKIKKIPSTKGNNRR